MDSIGKRVQRGAELLDKECPDWRERIDLETLNISSVTKDILGQLFGCYNEVTEKNWKIHAEINKKSGEYFCNRASHFGFATSWEKDKNKELTAAWKELLKPKDKVRELARQVVYNYNNPGCWDFSVAMVALKEELEKENNDNQ